MKKLPGSSKPYLTVALLSLVAFLILPVMNYGCIPYFDKNVAICSYRWNWFGGFHVINQKIHSLSGVPLDEWHNYLMYEIWALLILVVSAVLIAVSLYLLINFWRNKKASTKKASKKSSANPLLLPLVLLLIVMGLNYGVYRTLFSRNYEEMRIMAPGEGIFEPGIGVIPSEVNGSGPQDCMNNKPERCVLAPTVDLYPSPGESMENPEYKTDENSTMKEIGGVMQRFSGKTVTIKTTSGKLYSITFPIDVITWWNQERSPDYDGYQLSNGEIITVMYLEPLNEHSTEIKPSQIFGSRFAIDPKPKSDTSPIKRYSGPLE
jgi:hypothetical protein